MLLSFLEGRFIFIVNPASMFEWMEKLLQYFLQELLYLFFISWENSDWMITFQWNIHIIGGILYLLLSLEIVTKILKTFCLN